MGWLPSVKWDLKWKKWVQLFKVEKMRLIKEKIEELNIINKNWIDIARDEINNEKEPSNQQLVKLFNELWNLIRESLKEDYKGTAEILKTHIEGNSEWLLEDVNESLNRFWALEPLRNMQKDKEKCIEIIQYFCDNVILYFDPQFANKYLSFGFETAEIFWKIAQAIDGLVGYYVSRHYTAQAIKKDLQEETGFDEYICEYISDWIKANYQTLQLNVLMDTISINASEGR